MKIIYTGYIKDLNSSMGVVKKMLDLEKAAKRKKINLKVIFFTSSVIPDYLKTKAVFIPRKKYSFFWHYRFLNSLKYIAHKTGCTHLLLRHSGFSPTFPISFHQKNFQLITEHNTLELPEYLANRNIPFYISEFLTQRICFKSIDAIIAVTDEIAKYEIERSQINRDKVLVMTNGVDFKNIPFTPVKQFNGKNIDLIFVGSKNFPWVGLDRLFSGLKKTAYNIKLHLVGEIDKTKSLDKAKNYITVLNHGKLSGEKIDNLFKKCNLAISSLAIHRNHMSQACPLKSREYCARGMPFIYSYDDPDIDGHQGVKKFPINSNPIDLIEIIDFINEINQNNLHQICTNLRSSLQNKIDINLKINDLLEFLQKINVI